MADRVKEAEQVLIRAAQKMLEAKVLGHDLDSHVNEVLLRAHYLGQTAHGRDVYRRSMPRKRRK